MKWRFSISRYPVAVPESADHHPIRSCVRGPIGEMNRLERSLLFSELSMVAYSASETARPVLRGAGFEEMRYIERDGAQVFVVANDHDVVVVCRGTEPEWNDIRADVNAWTDPVEPFGRLHRGFKREVDDIWPTLEEALLGERRPIWFTGHSLGGAMSAICAARCSISPYVGSPREVITFGSPRVGTSTYLRRAGVVHIRWVNNNDIVTRLPPTWLRYRHIGIPMYIDRNGVVCDLTPQRRASDRWVGFVDGLRQRRLDHMQDHAIADYVRHLSRALGHDG